MSNRRRGTDYGGTITAHAPVIGVQQAVAQWEPEGIVNTSGKATRWNNSGPGGSNYDLLSVSGPTDPTYSATGNRTGGPAILFVRADATRLATIAFTLNPPVTILWVVKLTSEAANMRLSDARTGNQRGLYYTAETFNIFDGGQVIDNSGAVTVDTWYRLSGVYGGAGAGASSVWRNTTKTAGTLSGTAASGVVLGDFGTGGGAAWDGTVERGYLWTQALTDSDLTAIITKLA